MPSLSLCGRHWALASDDLPALALFGAFFHGAWLLLLIVFSVLAISLRRPKDCEELAVFMGCLILSTFISTTCDVLIIKNGLKGSIMQPSLRRYVEIVMYGMSVNFLIKIGIIGYGTYLVFFQRPTCLKDTTELDKLMQAVILSTWVIAILYVCLFVASYQAFPKNSVLQWKRRIRCVNWCCCGGFDRTESESLARMALVFERFFNPMNFSVTDTLASIILAAKRQSFLRHQTDFDALPISMTTLYTVSERNIVARGMGSENGLESDADRRPGKLMTVVEDEELELVDLEEGSASPGDEPFLWNGAQIPGNSELDVPIAEFDAEIQNMAASGPRHRRIPSLDFSEFDKGGQNPRFGEGTSGQVQETLHGSISSPDSAGPIDSVPSNLSEQRPNASSSAAEIPNSNHDAVSEGGDSDASIISWGDDFSGPILIPSSHSTPDLTQTAPKVDYNTLERIYLYHRYALASYGALLYLASGKHISDIFGRFFGLCIHAAHPVSVHSCSSHGSQAQSPLGSQRGASLGQRLNEEAVLRYGFKKENILYMSHEDVLAGHLPYFVALDREDKAIVVAVRGTWSWSDLVTDFLMHPEPLSEAETVEVNQLLADLRGFHPNRAACLPNVSVHSGMLRSARGLIQNMQNVGMLEFLETGSCQLAASHAGMDLPDMQQWKFVMTGHSLGAGVVALATLLLKSRFPRRQIECFAISPPGCAMSPELATAMSPFCHSLVHGKDIVPRISVSTVERLRDQMVRAAALCRRSKMRILFSGLLNLKWTEDQLFLKPEQVEAEPLDALRKYRVAVRHETLEDLAMAREFIPPGKIVFLRPTKTCDASSSIPGRDFEAVWISGRDLMQEGILLSLYTIKDHFPYFSIESLRTVMERRGDF